MTSRPAGWNDTGAEEELIGRIRRRAREVLLPPAPPENLPAEVAAAAGQLGLRDVTILRRSGKSLLSAANLAGQAAAGTLGSSSARRSAAADLGESVQRRVVGVRQ